MQVYPQTAIRSISNLTSKYGVAASSNGDLLTSGTKISFVFQLTGIFPSNDVDLSFGELLTVSFLNEYRLVAGVNDPLELLHPDVGSVCQRLETFKRLAVQRNRYEVLQLCRRQINYHSTKTCHKVVSYETVVILRYYARPCTETTDAIRVFICVALLVQYCTLARQPPQ